MTATEAERRLYGDLLDDALYLRERGHVVARFKGDYRVDRDVVTAAELRSRANAERARLASVKAPVLCGCGKPASHKGMCPARWVKRKANNGPSGLRNGIAKGPDRAPAKTIAALQAKVAAPNLAAAPQTDAARIDALEARVAEIERRLERGMA